MRNYIIVTIKCHSIKSELCIPTMAYDYSNWPILTNHHTSSVFCCRWVDIPIYCPVIMHTADFNCTVTLQLHQPFIPSLLHYISQHVPPILDQVHLTTTAIPPAIPFLKFNSTEARERQQLSDPLQ